MKQRTPGAETCPEACGAICCRYIVNKIPAPRRKLDFDELYWFLCHDRIGVFIEGRKWYLLVEVPCRHLNARSRCRIYAERPYVCREHSPKECEYWGEIDRKIVLRTPDDLRRHMKRRGLRFRMAWDEPDGPSDKPARISRHAPPARKRGREKSRASASNRSGAGAKARCREGRTRSRR